MVSVAVAIALLLLHRQQSAASAKLVSKSEEGKRLEDALHKSEEKYKIIFEEASDGIILLDKEKAAIADFNPRMADMLGYSMDDFQKLEADKIECPKRDNIIKLIRKDSKTGSSDGKPIHFKTKLNGKNGEKVDAFLTAKDILICERKYLLLICRDLSSDRQFERKLHDFARFSNTLIEANPSPIFYKNREGRYIGCNAAFESFIGLKRDQIIGKTVFEVASEEMASKCHEKDGELFASPGIQVYDHKIKKKDGSVRDVIINKATYTDRKGNVIGLIGSISDVTELRKINRELNISVKTWQDTFDAFDDIIFIIDKNYRILQSNKSAKTNFLGINIDGSLCYKIVHGDNAPPEYCLCRQTFEKGVSKSVESFNSLLNKYIEFIYYPVKNQKGEVVQVIHVLKDINVRKKVEQELIRSRKALLAQNKALTRWIDSETILKMPMEKLLAEITKEISTVLNAAMVGIWFFDSKKEKITCACVYDKRKNAFDSGNKLKKSDFPEYFETLLRDKILSADNAHTDSGTMELLQSYLIPRGITSMMDTLISVGGEPLGVLCCEHTGEPRNWSIDENSYAISMANIISLYFQSSKCENTEKMLNEQTGKFDDMMKYAEIGIMVVNGAERAVYVNPAAEIFFGDKIKDILGEKCPEEILKCDGMTRLDIIRKDKSKGTGLIISEKCKWDDKDARIFAIKDISG
jgi:PAS domain S-box-containing protein